MATIKYVKKVLDRYIHLHAYNYISHGLNRISETPQPPSSSDLILNDSYLMQKSALRIQDSKEKRAQYVLELQNKYQEIIYGNGQNADFSKFRQDTAQAINQLLQEKFNKAAQVRSFGQVSDINLLKLQSENIIRHELRQIEINNNTTVSQVRTILRQLIARYEKVLKGQGNFFNGARGTLQAQLATINGAEADIKKSIELLKTWEYTLFRKRSTKHLQNINVESINQYIDAINKSYFPIRTSESSQKGMIGEWLAPWIRFYLTGQALNYSIDQIKHFMESANRGREGIYVGFKEGKRIEFTRQQIQEGKSRVGLTYHTSKADAQVEIGYDGQNNPITEKLSVKNYKQTGSVKMVSGTAAATLLQSSGNQDWIGHFINAVITHPELNDNDDALLGLKTIAKINFNKLALYNAVAGYSQIQSPDLIIIFDYANKKVKIFDSYLLILELLQQSKYTSPNSKMSSFSVLSVAKSYGKAKAEIQGLEIPQKRQDTVEARLSNIKSYLHSTTISVKVSLDRM